MGRELQFHETGAVLRLSPLTGLFALKFHIDISYDSIQEVRVERFAPPPWMLRLPGTAIPPLHVFEGSFLYENEWYFLSFERDVPLLIVRLAGHEKYTYIIVQLENPTAAAAELRRRIRSQERD